VVVAVRFRSAVRRAVDRVGERGEHGRVGEVRVGRGGGGRGRGGGVGRCGSGALSRGEGFESAFTLGTLVRGRTQVVGRRKVIKREGGRREGRGGRGSWRAFHAAAQAVCRRLWCRRDLVLRAVLAFVLGRRQVGGCSVFCVCSLVSHLPSYKVHRFHFGLGWCSAGVEEEDVVHFFRVASVDKVGNRC
jgi:hypothetical protein